MKNELIINELVSAYRKAERDFAAAQADGSTDRAFAFARIIGSLEGAITGAAFHLGFSGSMRDGGIR